MKITKYNLWGLVLGICSIPLMWGIFHPGFFVSDDGSWMVIRLSAFYSALSSGQLPVRFLPQLNNGFGYPVADFLYPLFLYIGSFLHFLKIPFLLDIKLIFTASIIFSGIGMFLFLRKHFSEVSAAFGGLTYMYLPYHVYDVYIRGSLGEVVSLAVVPFLFWAIEKRSISLMSIFVGLLILAHNTLALFFFPVAILYAYIRKTSVRSILIFSVTGILVSAFFWLPALFDKQFTVFDATVVANPFGYFVNTVSYQLVGWIAVALFVGVFFIKFSVKNKALIFFYAIGLISLFLSFSVSSFVWHIQLLSQLVQFPYRFLSIVLLSESFLAAYLIEHFQKKSLLTSFLVLLLLFSALPYIFPTKFDYKSESFYDTNTATTTVQNEYMPKWVATLPETYPAERVVTDASLSSISQVFQKGTNIIFSDNAQKQSAVTVRFVYFPGWMGTVDGKQIVVGHNTAGLLQLQVPQGKHSVHVWFGETPIRLFADGLSVLGLLIVGFLFFKRKI